MPAQPKSEWAGDGLGIVTRPFLPSTDATFTVTALAGREYAVLGSRDLPIQADQRVLMIQQTKIHVFIPGRVAVEIHCRRTESCLFHTLTLPIPEDQWLFMTRQWDIYVFIGRVHGIHFTSQ